MSAVPGPTNRPSAAWAEGLNDRERVFVEEYLIDLSGRKAALRMGVTENSANNTARRWLSQPNVAASIDRALAERPGVTRARIVDELARIAFGNLNEFVDWSPAGATVIDSKDLTDEQRSCVAEVKQTQTEFGTNITFKLHDKVGALEKLGKTLRMFVDRQEVSGPEGAAIQVDDIRGRVIGRLERLRKRSEESANVDAPKPDIAADTPVPEAIETEGE